MSRIEVPENEWRLSRSGYSIKAGWADDKRIIAVYPGGIASPLDSKRFKQWMADAEHICELHNAARNLPADQLMNREPL